MSDISKMSDIFSSKLIMVPPIAQLLSAVDQALQKEQLRQAKEIEKQTIEEKNTNKRSLTSDSFEPVKPPGKIETV